MATRKTLLLYLIVALVAAGVGFAMAKRNPAPDGPQQALVLNLPRPLPEFSLADHRGEAFARERLEGRWTLIFFGFTHCPDVCPTTLQTLAAARRELADLPQGRQPAVVMVSVDPGRDTPAQMAGYVPYFHPEFVGVTGGGDGLRALTASLGVAFSYAPNPNGEAYAVDHTAAIFLVDPDAALAAVFGTPHDAGRISADYRYITGGRR